MLFSCCYVWVGACCEMSPHQNLKTMDKKNKQGFAEYLEKFVPFIWIDQDENGVDFLNVFGYDCGGVTETGLPFWEVEYERPEEIDKHIDRCADSLQERKPEVSYSKFCEL